MTSKESRKKIKQIQKKIDQLNKELQKMEIRPCKGDAELELREKDLKNLRYEIRTLEKNRDRYRYTWWNKV